MPACAGMTDSRQKGVTMEITHYSFGRIVIDGQTYTSDVIIFPDYVDSLWWRKEGHLLQIADLKDIMTAKLSVLIIGTGFFGTMRVPEETIDYLKSNKIDIYIEYTQQAVKLYNEISSQKPTIAALHLTC